MGKLVDGQWVDGNVISSDSTGSFKRTPRTFLETISKDHEVYQPDSGRYHLYVSFACPWAHRTLIFRQLKELQSHIAVDVVSPDMRVNGWTFDSTFEGSTGDSLNGLEFLYQLYQKALAGISTSVMVPVLWDRQTETIVNNESSEIVRILNTAFNDLTGNTDDYYPEALRGEIDQWNDRIYHTVNNGVYEPGLHRVSQRTMSQ